MKKGILILVILGVLVVGVLGANYYYSKDVEKGVLTLYKDISETLDEDGAYLDWGDVSVNLLTRKIVTKDILIYEEKAAKMKCDKLLVKLSWKDMMYFLRNDRLDEVHDVNITFQNVEFEEAQDDSGFSVKDINLAYEGYLNGKMISKYPELILDESHTVAIEFSELKYKLPDMSDVGIATKAYQNMSELDSISIKMDYDSVEQQFTLSEMGLDSSNGSYNACGSFKVAKDNLGSFYGDDIKFTFKCSAEDVKDDSNELVGQLKLNSILMNLDLAIDWDSGEYKLTNAIVDATMKGYEVELPAEYGNQLYMASMGMLDPDLLKKIVIDNMVIDCDITTDNAEVLMDVDTPALDVTLDLDLNLGGLEPYINKGVLKVSDMSQNAKDFISVIEAMGLIPLPRKGEDIVIEVWGFISNPQIKGMNI